LSPLTSAPPLLSQDKDPADPSRVGGPTNPLLKDGLTTVIGGGPGAAGALANALRRTAGRAGGNEDRANLAAFRAIGKLGEALGLVKSVRDRACEIYVKDVSVEGARGRVERKKRGGEVLRERRDSARAPRRARLFFFSNLDP